MNLAALAEQNLAEFGVYDRLVFGDTRYTNLELHEASLRLATGLRELGLAPGDRVMLLLTNRPEVLISYAAIWRIGAVAVPTLFLLESHELAFIAQNCQARGLIVSQELLAKLAQVEALGVQFDHVVVVGAEAPGGAHSQDSAAGRSEREQFTELCAAAPFGEPAPRAKSDLAVLVYTSGTTGKPKGVMQTHGNLLAAAQNSQASGRRTREGDVGLLVLPLAHSFGLGVMVSGYLFGGKSVLLRWFEPGLVLNAIAEHRVTAMAGVPSMFISMLNQPDAEHIDTSSVERWLVGAAPMPTQQLARFEQRFGGTMYVGYGLTEACPGIAVEREGMPRKPGSTGVAMAGVEVRVVGEGGEPLAAGVAGEVIARGDNISPGYLGLPEETAASFKGGWLYTGDVGYLDEDGYLFIVERKKDLIIRGGFNVYPKDVEEALHHLPQVAECAVVGVPHEVLGEEVAAYIVLRAGQALDADAVKAHTQSLLAKYKTPSHVVFCASLPKNGIGKIMKKELRRIAAEELTASAADPSDPGWATDSESNPSSGGGGGGDAT